MKTFIRVIEAWTPSADGSLLEFAGGVFGTATTLLAMSRAMCFGRAEGLPGRAWEAEQPVLLPRLEGSTYRRSAAATAAGLGCAVAVPLFVGDALSSVVVFYGAAVAAPGAAIELWGHDERVTADLSLAEGCYLGSATALEAISRDSYLPRGSGLPGRAWQLGEAVFIDDLVHSPYFLRAEEAAAAGMQRALALPCTPRGSRQHVLAFLAAEGLPIARRIDSWVMSTGAGASALHCRFSHVADPESVAAAEAAAAAIDSAYFSGVPAFADFGPAGSVAAIPIASEGAVSEVLALYF